MVSIPRDIAENVGTVKGEYIFFKGWKYKIICCDAEKYIANPVGRNELN